MSEYKDESDASAEEFSLSKPLDAICPRCHSGSSDVRLMVGPPEFRYTCIDPWHGQHDASAEEVSQHDANMAAVARHKVATPRTDATFTIIPNELDANELYNRNGEYVPKEDMRQLERELAAANKRADEARAMAIEDVIAFDAQESGFFDEGARSELRELATLQPGFVVVPVEPYAYATHDGNLELAENLRWATHPKDFTIPLYAKAARQK